MRNTILLVTIIIIFTCELLLTTTSLLAQERSGVERLGRLYNYWSWTSGIAVEDDYAYVTTSFSGLQIVDISDPTNPYVKGFVDDYSEQQKSVALSGGYAFVIDREYGLQIFNVSDSENPTWVNNVEIEETPYNLTISSNYLYLNRNPEFDYEHSELIVFNITDPEDPQEVGSYDYNGNTWQIKVVNEHAFVCAGGEGLHILNVADPEDIYLVGSYDTTGAVHDIIIRDNLAYTAWGMCGLVILDLAELENPRRLGSVSEREGYINHIAIYNDYAYLCDDNTGLRICDITDPTDPSLIRHLEELKYSEITIVDETGWALEFGELIALDLSEPEDLIELARSNTSGSVIDVATVGNLAYSIGYGRMSVIDISNLRNPIEIGSLDEFTYGTCITVSGDYAYVGDDEGAYDADLKIIDITNPDELSVVGTFEAPGGIDAIASSGDFVYLVGWQTGFVVLDCENRQSPRQVAILDTSVIYNCNDVLIKDDYAFIAGGEDGIIIVDITDPTDPIIEARLRANWRLLELSIENDILYALDWDQLLIVDISDPLIPSFYGSMDLPVLGEDLTVCGDYVYIADADAGLRIINVENPRQPYEVGHFLTPGLAINVAATGNIVLVADLSNLGIYDPTEALQVSNSETVSINSIELVTFPNPFNALTTIKYNLPSHTKASLTIYDLSGKHITTLMDGQVHPSIHIALWNATDQPSGLYFVRLETANQVFTQKVMLIR